jgi:hypothetical protein
MEHVGAKMSWNNLQSVDELCTEDDAGCTIFLDSISENSLIMFLKCGSFHIISILLTESKQLYLDHCSSGVVRKFLVILICKTSHAEAIGNLIIEKSP